MPPLHSLHSGAQVLARRQSYGPCQRGADAPTMQEVGQPWPGHHRCIAGSVRPAAGLSPPRSRRRLHSTRGTACLSLSPEVRHIIPTAPSACSTGAGLVSPHCEQPGSCELLPMSSDSHGPSNELECRMLVGP